MTKEKVLTQDKFFGGIVRDDKSKVRGALSNAEEVDIFSNADFIQAEQIMSSDSMPASTEIYAYTAGDDDTVYGYGKNTANNAVRLVSVASGGATNPGAFGTLATSSDTTNLATIVSDLQFFRTVEASNPTSLYYIKGTSTTWYLVRYNIGAAAEQRWTGSAWSASGALDSNTQLTGLNGTAMRPTMKVIFGELMICNGRYIAKVDRDGTLTEKAFTLPSEWEAVDIIAVADKALILCRNKNRLVNQSKAFWWDLTATEGFEDSFGLPVNNPLWIVNHKETIKMACGGNNVLRLFQLSGPFQGAIPIELPDIALSNIDSDASLQPISSPKMVSQKDNILYFGLNKSDKTGIYALGQLDSKSPQALILSKRFATTNYANHASTALWIQGPNYYAAFDDNGTASNSRCESANSPTRSSNAVIETTWIDDNKPLQSKDLVNVITTCKALPSSTSLTASVATDYTETYTSLTRADGTVLNTANAVLGKHVAGNFINKKAFKVKVAFASSGVNSPKLQSVGLQVKIKEEIASY